MFFITFLVFETSEVDVLEVSSPDLKDQEREKYDLMPKYSNITLESKNVARSSYNSTVSR